MNTLTSEAISDYMVCELYYQCKYELEEPVPMTASQIKAERFENTLKKIASYFFYKKQAESPPSYSMLLRRWEKLWFPKNMTPYDLAVEQHTPDHRNLAAYSNTAAASLELFYDNFIDDSAVPVMINESFNVPLNQSAILNGEFDLIVKKGNDYHIVKWCAVRGNNARASRSVNFFDFPTLRYAFEYQSDKKRNVYYHLYNLGDTNKGFYPVEQPHVDDISAMRYWADEIVQSESFIPRRGFTSYCSNCPFDEICKNFDWNDTLKAKLQRQ